MPPATSDSSTVIHLARIGRLGLLRDRFREVLVPGAVWREVVEEGAGRPASVEVARAWQDGWVRQVAPKNADLVALLMQTLGPGESEVIALATEDRRLTALLDESDARHAAAVYGLKVTGVVGILLRAKREGRIPSLKAELDRLRTEGAFWLRDQVYRAALEAVQERP